MSWTCSEPSLFVLVERLSSFWGYFVLSVCRKELLIGRFVLFRSVLYQRFHCIYFRTCSYLGWVEWAIKVLIFNWLASTVLFIAGCWAANWLCTCAYWDLYVSCILLWNFLRIHTWHCMTRKLHYEQYIYTIDSALALLAQSWYLW